MATGRWLNLSPAHLVAAHIRHMGRVDRGNAPVVEDAQAVQRPAVVDTPLHHHIKLLVLVAKALAAADLKDDIAVIHQLEVHAPLLKGLKKQLLLGPHPAVQNANLHIIRPNLPALREPLPG